MQRYFIPKTDFLESTVRISGDDAHHLVRVMRARVGDHVICSNGEDREAEIEITHVDKNEVLGRVVKELELLAEPKLQVWIAQSLPKGDKMETILQKCTEIGAVRFIPFLSARTVVQYDAKKEAKRLERWEKIVKEAAEQAHRNRVPQIDAPVSWKQMLSLVKETNQSMICYEKENGLSIRQWITDQSERQDHLNESPRIMLLIVGPEGGLTEQEVKEAEAVGCRSVGLGPRILRTETAAMVGLTCLLYEYQELGG